MLVRPCFCVSVFLFSVFRGLLRTNLCHAIIFYSFTTTLLYIQHTAVQLCMQPYSFIARWGQHSRRSLYFHRMSVFCRGPCVGKSGAKPTSAPHRHPQKVVPFYASQLSTQSRLRCAHHNWRRNNPHDPSPPRVCPWHLYQIFTSTKKAKKVQPAAYPRTVLPNICLFVCFYYFYFLISIFFPSFPCLFRGGVSGNVPGSVATTVVRGNKTQETTTRGHVT